MTAKTLTPEQQEIAELLQSEFQEIKGYAESTDLSTSDAHSVLSHFCEALEPMASALELAGLIGLSQASAILVDKFAEYVASVDSDADVPALFLKWPDLFANYLAAFVEGEETEQAVSAVIAYLDEAPWHTRVSHDRLASLAGAFADSHFSSLSDNGDIPEIATPEMMSLTPSGDARRELIDGMLLELPRQSQDLESSVERFLDSQELEDLTQARRMAHTLKGSANIVGISAIANLMHYLEDILEFAARHPIEDQETFRDLLLDCSDNLAMSTEFLTGIGPAPEDGVSVLQSVLDFSRALYGDPSSGDASTPESSAIVGLECAQTIDEPSFFSSTEIEAFDQVLLDGDEFESGEFESDELGDDQVEADLFVEDSEGSIALEFDDEVFDLTDSAEGLPVASKRAEPPLDNEESLSDFSETIETAVDDELSSATADNIELEDLTFQDYLSGGSLPDSSSGLLGSQSELTDIDESGLGDGVFDDSDLLSEDDFIGDLDGDDLDITIEEVASSDIEVPYDAPLEQGTVLPAGVVSENSVNDSAATIASDTASTEENEAEEDQYRLSVPMSTAQELLRVAGETQIANSQILAQVESMQGGIKSTESYQLRLRNMANELETLVQTQNALRAAAMKYADNEIDPMELERYSELDTFSNQLIELTTDAHEAIAQVEDQLRELTTIAYTQQQLNKDAQSTLLRLRMIPVDVMSSRFSRCVRQASRLSRKSVHLTIEGEQQLVDSMVLNRIVDPLMHLLRNAVDHGIEDSEAERIAGGKSSEGEIRLRFEQQGETLLIQCQDNGRGLDYEKIRERAMTANVIAADASLDDGMLQQLIFLPGFSTKDSASQTSGRGIGLDAVMNEIKGLKGHLTIDSVQGEGTTFNIRVPTSILTGHSVLVRCSNRFGAQKLSIVSRNIEQIIYLSSDQLIAREDKTFIGVGDEEVEVVNLNVLVNLFSDYNDSMTAVLLTRKASGEPIAVGIESVIASQDMVVKPLNRYVFHPPGTVGATILGDGTVSPVIDLQELPGVSMSTEDWANWQKQLSKAQQFPRAADGDTPIALIVDDSLSARRSLAQFVTELGMQAVMAKDGFDAISVIEGKRPSLVLVDLEMPRMNGLELTAHLRSRPETQDVPVIMITSRTTEKHREMAESVGVNTYLNKPWSEEELLACIESELALG